MEFPEISVNDVCSAPKGGGVQVLTLNFRWKRSVAQYPFGRMYVGFRSLWIVMIFRKIRIAHVGRQLSPVRSVLQSVTSCPVESTYIVVYQNLRQFFSPWGFPCSGLRIDTDQGKEELLCPCSMPCYLLHCIVLTAQTEVSYLMAVRILSVESIGRKQSGCVPKYCFRHWLART